MKYVKVSEAKTITLEELGGELIIPSEFHDVFRDKCSCGSDFIISTTRRSMMCSNPFCYRKLAYQSVKMFSEFQIKQYGPETALKHAQNLYERAKMAGRDHITVIDFLKDPPLDFVLMVKQELMKPRTWAESIASLNIPYLGSATCIKVFRGNQNLEEFTKSMQKEGGALPYLQKRLGGSTLPNNVLNTIKEHLEEIAVIQDLFTIIPDVEAEYKITVTGDVIRQLGESGETLSRLAYIKYINSKLSEYSLKVVLSKAYSQVVAVIADYESSSASYRAGKQRKIILPSDMLIPFILRLHEERMKAKNE